MSREQFIQLLQHAYEAGRDYQRADMLEYRGGPENDEPTFTAWLNKTLPPATINELFYKQDRDAAELAALKDENYTLFQKVVQLTNYNNTD
jgi:hypothetical protein